MSRLVGFYPVDKVSSVVITLASLKITTPLFQSGEQIMPTKMFDIPAPLPALAGLVGFYPVDKM